jgi:hypothetical protein
MTLDLEGKNPVTIEAGEIYHETPNEKMLAKNTSASENLKIIVFQVGTQGKPMMIEAKNDVQTAQEPCNVHTADSCGIYLGLCIARRGVGRLDTVCIF